MCGRIQHRGNREKGRKRERERGKKERRKEGKRERKMGQPGVAVPEDTSDDPQSRATIEWRLRLKRTPEKRRRAAALQNLLLGGFDFCGSGFGSGVGVLLGEALDAAGGVNQLLLAGEEGVAVRADFDIQPVALDGRTGGEIVTAGAMHRYGVIVGVDTGFHEAPFCRVRSARLSGKAGGLQPRR